MSLQFEPIGHIESCFPELRGTPRQGALMPSSRARLKLAPHISHHAFDGLEEYSHVWLIWSFHANRERTSGGKHTSVKAKIRPPKKADGGKVGIFATRTPHRPNCIGQTLVRLDRVERCFEGGAEVVAAAAEEEEEVVVAAVAAAAMAEAGAELDVVLLRSAGTAATDPKSTTKKKKKKKKIKKTKRRETAYLCLSAIDLVDGTPILDIKPYIPLYEAVPDASVPSWVSSAYETPPLVTRFAPGATEQLRALYAAAPIAALPPSPPGRAMSRREKRSLQRKQRVARERTRFYPTSEDVQGAVCDLLALDIRSGATRTRRNRERAEAVEGGETVKRDARYDDFCLSFDGLKITCHVDAEDDDAVVVGALAPETIVVVAVEAAGKEVR